MWVSSWNDNASAIQKTAVYFICKVIHNTIAKYCYWAERRSLLMSWFLMMGVVGGHYAMHADIHDCNLCNAVMIQDTCKDEKNEQQ